jgi:hypothetical protein
MIQAQTQTSAVPVTEPNKNAPDATGPQQTDDAKKAAADKAKTDATQNPSVKS